VYWKNLAFLRMRRHFYNLLLIECRKFKSGRAKNMLPSYTTNKYCFHIVHVVLLTIFLFFFYFLIFQVQYISLSIFYNFILMTSLEAKWNLFLRLLKFNALSENLEIHLLSICKLRKSRLDRQGTFYLFNFFSYSLIMQFYKVQVIFP